MARQADADLERFIRKIDADFQTARRNFRCWARGTSGQGGRKPTVAKLEAGVTPEVKAQVTRLAGEIVQRRLATVQAAALALERSVLRPATDLVTLLLQEVGQDLGAGDEAAFESALNRAKRTIFADVAAGIR